MSDIDIQGWPPLLVEVAELTSPETALKLVLAHGGVACYFPKVPRADHVVVQTIGLEAAMILATAFGGTSPEIPVLATKRQLKRAIAASTGGTSEVARKLGCSSRYVRMVRNSGGPDPRQLGLFDGPLKTP